MEPTNSLKFVKGKLYQWWVRYEVVDGTPLVRECEWRLVPSE